MAFWIPPPTASTLSALSLSSLPLTISFHEKSASGLKPNAPDKSPTCAEVSSVYWQEVNLNDTTWLTQSSPLILKYSWLYQNVQSSLGSILMLL